MIALYTGINKMYTLSADEQSFFTSRKEVAATATRYNITLQCELLLRADHPNPGLDARLGMEGDVHQDQAVEVDPRAVGLAQVLALLLSLRLPVCVLESVNSILRQKVSVTSVSRSCSAMYMASLPRVMTRTSPFFSVLAVNWADLYVMFWS